MMGRSPGTGGIGCGVRKQLFVSSCPGSRIVCLRLPLVFRMLKCPLYVFRNRQPTTHRQSILHNLNTVPDYIPVGYCPCHGRRYRAEHTFIGWSEQPREEWNHHLLYSGHSTSVDTAQSSRITLASHRVVSDSLVTHGSQLSPSVSKVCALSWLGVCSSKSPPYAGPAAVSPGQ